MIRIHGNCDQLWRSWFLPTQELAWASFALMKNTNISGLLVFLDERVLVARGAVLSTDSGKLDALDSVSSLNSMFYSQALPEFVENLCHYVCGQV